MMALLVSGILFCAAVQAAPSFESLQLQQLLESSQKQLESLKSILSYQKQDAASLDRADQVLENLSSGINRSIEKYRDTQEYQKALIELQAQDDFKKTYWDSQQVKEHSPPETEDVEDSAKKAFDDLVKFQKESVEANQTDLSNQERLQQALKSAQPGFIPKIQAQTQLGNWEASTRLSAQLTELLGAVHAVREELRGARLREEKGSALTTLMNGSELQNQIQRQEKTQ